jgi:hypothetical protein
MHTPFVVARWTRRGNPPTPTHLVCVFSVGPLSSDSFTPSSTAHYGLFQVHGPEGLPPRHILEPAKGPVPSSLFSSPSSPLRSSSRSPSSPFRSSSPLSSSHISERRNVMPKPKPPLSSAGSMNAASRLPPSKPCSTTNTRASPSLSASAPSCAAPSRSPLCTARLPDSPSLALAPRLRRQLPLRRQQQQQQLPAFVPALAISRAPQHLLLPSTVTFPTVTRLSSAVLLAVAEMATGKSAGSAAKWATHNTTAPALATVFLPSPASTSSRTPCLPSLLCTVTRNWPLLLIPSGGPLGVSQQTHHLTLSTRTTRTRAVQHRRCSRMTPSCALCFPKIATFLPRWVNRNERVFWIACAVKRQPSPSPRHLTPPDLDIRVATTPRMIAGLHRTVIIDTDTTVILT